MTTTYASANRACISLDYQRASELTQQHGETVLTLLQEDDHILALIPKFYEVLPNRGSLDNKKLALRFAE